MLMISQPIASMCLLCGSGWHAARINTPIIYSKCALQSYVSPVPYKPELRSNSSPLSNRETSLTLPDGFTGFERILLTANGNLQRLLSAFFNQPVKVEILENNKVALRMDEDPAVIARYQREVNLLCESKVVCNAKSQVLIKDKEVYDLVANKGVGIGQIFRYLDRLPSFDLHGLGRTENTFWREYSLRIPGVDCRLLEVFPSTLSEDGWLSKPADSISWDVELSTDDKMAWIKPYDDEKQESKTSA